MMTRLVFPLLSLLFLLTSCVSTPKSMVVNAKPAELHEQLSMDALLKVIRESDRVQGVRVKSPWDTNLRGRIRGKITDKGKLFDLQASQVSKLKALLGNRQTYFDGRSMCLFDPGVRFVFHHPQHGDLDFLLCLKCSEMSVRREGKELAFVAFLPARSAIADLMIEIFPDHQDIVEMIKREREAASKRNVAEARWLAATPKSLLHVKTQGDGISPTPDLTPYRKPLENEFPDKTSRTLALLHWFGSGEGPWSGFYACEMTPERLLLHYPTIELLKAIESTSLTETQTEGAARFFSGNDFDKQRPEDLKTLPANLKKKLLEHSMKSKDKDKRGRAKRAFSN